MKILKPIFAIRHLEIFAGLVLSVFLFNSILHANGPHREPANVAGPDACGECHKESLKLWKLSKHFTEYKKMSKSKEARAIAKELGIKRIKKFGNICVNCHFTSSIVQDKVKTIAGTACESCHGAGKPWIKLHSDFGGKDMKAKDEVPAHKVERYRKSEAEGLIRQSNLYGIAQNCYSCHFILNEKLVNQGGHSVDKEFELLSWTQGEVRHNVYYSKGNQEAPVERRRMLFLVGKMFDLDYAYRGMAVATKEATFSEAMAKRVKATKLVLEKIAGLIDSAEVRVALNIANRIKLNLNSRDSFIKAADDIAANTKRLAENDGMGFSALDSMLPMSDKYMGKVSQ